MFKIPNPFKSNETIAKEFFAKQPEVKPAAKSKTPATAEKWLKLGEEDEEAAVEGEDWQKKIKEEKNKVKELI